MKARVTHYELDFVASKDLVKKSHQSQNQANKILADLRQAQAEAKAAELDLARTRITAPFEGVFVKGNVDEGTYLARGDVLGHLVSLNPLRTVVFVGEQDYNLLQVGQACELHLSAGSKHSGTVVFKSPRSPNKTHTFEAHIEFPNPDSQIPEGVSATVFVSLNHTAATALPASLLTLNDAGLMGVKVVGEGTKVSFIPLTLLSGDHEKVIVSGLNEPTRIITRGQEFVTEGQVVAYEDEPATIAPAEPSKP
jgi:multidrug efflux system membrane fusion protein